MDVWWCNDGAMWNQVTKLFDDVIQGIRYWNTKVGGYVLTWYSRYGHSFEVLEVPGESSYVKQ